MPAIATGHPGANTPRSPGDSPSRVLSSASMLPQRRRQQLSAEERRRCELLDLLGCWRVGAGHRSGPLGPGAGAVATVDHLVERLRRQR